MALSTSSVGVASRGRRGFSQVHSQPQGTELAGVLLAVSDHVTDTRLRSQVKNALVHKEKLSEAVLKDFNVFVTRGSALDKEVRRITGSIK